MIIILFGEDTFRIRQKLQLIKQKFSKKDIQGLNWISFDAEEKTSFDAIKGAIETVPFLTKKKTVALKNFFTRGRESVQKSLVDYFKKPFPEHVNLIVVEEFDEEDRKKLKKGNKKKIWQKLLSFADQQEDFTPLSPLALKNWIKSEVKKKGGSVEEDALSALVAYCGNDLWQIYQEINKLANYLKKDKRIFTVTKRTVDLLVQAKLNDRIFQTIDAVANKNISLALSCLQENLAVGLDPHYVLSMLIYQFRNLLKAKTLMLEGKNYYEIEKNLRLPFFVIRKTMNQARMFSLRQLKIIYGKLLSLDLSFKTSKINPSLALDLFVASIII